MKLRKLGLVAGAAALASVIAGSASAETVLRFASWAGPSHHFNYNLLPWLNEELKKRSNGDLSLKVEFGLAPPPALYDIVRDGVADLTWIVFGYTPGKFATPKLAELPGIPGNAEKISVAFQKTWDKYLSKANEAKGVKIMAVFVHGPGMLHTRQKITDYRQLDGMKIRLGGGVANAVGTALGVAGVNVPATQVYETLSSGVADGVFFPMETMYAFKVAELTKYSLKNSDGMYTTAFAVILNEDRYNSMSAANKKVIDGISGIEFARKIGQSWDEADTRGLKAAQEMGLQVIEASPEAKAFYKQKTAPIEQAVLKEVGERGVDAKAALEYLKEQVE